MKNLDIATYYTSNEKKEFSVCSIKNTYSQQADALNIMASNIDNEEYLKALDFMFNCKGHVIICGMGKSGHVGTKIAATLASTGTPAFFLHPSEAFHGDLGMITKEDVIILISNSGETDEVLQLIPSLRSFGNKTIAITGKTTSTLSKNSDATLQLVMDKEACPNNLAPTTSTTLTIAVGDALAVALMEMRQFEPNDFARFHPGGSLGKRLLTKVKDVMTSNNLPLVNAEDKMTDVIVKMNEGRKGVAIVLQDNNLVGIITDGDLRRSLVSDKPLSELIAKSVMSQSPKTCLESKMLNEAEEIMKSNDISTLIVLNSSESVTGLIQINTLY
ncbi:arabinose-5-phosphate isomerase [Vibrio sp. 10N.286.49.B3]|uniref:KpsF/GutQ family sugar-phosphate isomerase n=1 Tax=Vibrio sp. 10N.286.49.B3 TaxID=1880855 RepID=UPI000C827870|nr:KpsF/GutQ family sugar-phosphate isomerase [Vibrio sp. 10N.286.49.B3]PMH45934.1 arabinose-5-phosphate isomerase [Vibrio sp. 10N.286.49.B3]